MIMFNFKRSAQKLVRQRARGVLFVMTGMVLIVLPEPVTTFIGIEMVRRGLEMMRKR